MYAPKVGDRVVVVDSKDPVHVGRVGTVIATVGTVTRFYNRVWLDGDQGYTLWVAEEIAPVAPPNEGDPGDEDPGCAALTAAVATWETEAADFHLGYADGYRFRTDSIVRDLFGVGVAQDGTAAYTGQRIADRLAGKTPAYAGGFRDGFCRYLDELGDAAHSAAVAAGAA